MQNPFIACWQNESKEKEIFKKIKIKQRNANSFQSPSAREESSSAKPNNNYASSRIHFIPKPDATLVLYTLTYTSHQTRPCCKEPRHYYSIYRFCPAFEKVKEEEKEEKNQK